jgi:hypothetical protein
MLNRENTNERIQKSLNGRFLFYIGILFLLVYFALGLTLIFWKQLPLQMPYNFRVAFGLLLMIYATIRFGRLLKNNKK